MYHGSFRISKLPGKLPSIDATGYERTTDSGLIEFHQARNQIVQGRRGADDALCHRIGGVHIAGDEHVALTVGAAIVHMPVRMLYQRQKCAPVVLPFLCRAQVLRGDTSSARRQLNVVRGYLRLAINQGAKGVATLGIQSRDTLLGRIVLGHPKSSDDDQPNRSGEQQQKKECDGKQFCLQTRGGVPHDLILCVWVYDTRYGEGALYLLVLFGSHRSIYGQLWYHDHITLVALRRDERDIRE
jgi:hypothetical protein